MLDSIGQWADAVPPLVHQSEFFVLYGSILVWLEKTHEQKHERCAPKNDPRAKLLPTQKQGFNKFNKALKLGSYILDPPLLYPDLPVPYIFGTKLLVTNSYQVTRLDFLVNQIYGERTEDEG